MSLLFTKHKKKLRLLTPLLFVAVFGALGAYFLMSTHAQTVEQASVRWTTIANNELQNINSGLCVGTPGTAEAATYTKLTLQPCKATKGLEWSLAWGNGAVKTTTAVNGFGQCLDDTGESTKAGTQIEVYPCNKDPNSQTWSTGYGDGSIRIHNLCLGVNGNAKSTGANVVIMACTVTVTTPAPAPAPAPTPTPTPAPAPAPVTTTHKTTTPKASTTTATSNATTTPTTSQPNGDDPSSDTTSTDSSSTDSGSVTEGTSSNSTSNKSKPKTTQTSTKATKSSSAAVTFITLGILIPLCVLAIFFLKKKQSAQPAVSTAADSDLFLDTIASQYTPPQEQAGPMNPVPGLPSEPIAPNVPPIPIAPEMPASTYPPGQPPVPAAPGTPVVPPAHRGQPGEDEAATKARLEWWAANGGQPQPNATQQAAPEANEPTDMFEEGRRRLAAEEQIQNKYHEH